MRARESWLVGVLVASLCAGAVFAQATDEQSLENEPYNKHHDRHFGHDHVYPDRGSIFRDAPKGATIINYAGLPYRFANGVWFEPRGPAFIVVMPPIGVVVPSLPAFATPLELGGESYFYANDAYYLARPELGGYEVVNDPADMAATPARSGGGSGGVSGESAVVTAAPLAAAVPVAATGAVVAAGATNAAVPAATGVAAGTTAAAAPAGAMVARAAIRPAASFAQSASAAPDVAVGPTRAMASGATAAPGFAGNPTAPSVSNAPAVAASGLSAGGAAAAGSSYVAPGPTPSGAPTMAQSATVPAGSTQSLYAAAAPVPASATQSAYTPAAPAPTSATQPTYAAAAPVPTSATQPAYAASTPSTSGTAQPAYAAVAPAGTASPASPAVATTPDTGRMQMVANASPPSAPTAAAPTVPTYGAPTYGAPTYTAPAAGTAVAAAPPPPAVQAIPPGVTGIPILGSGAGGGAKLMAYPRNGQSQERQARDHYDCYQFGVAQGGFDPMRSGYGVASTGNQVEFERAQAACFEGRGYTVR